MSTQSEQILRSALSLPDGRIYKNSRGLDGYVIAETLREVAA